MAQELTLIQHIHPVARFAETDEQHRIEHGNLDIQFNQGGQAVEGFTEIHGLGLEIHFSTPALGRIMVMAPETIREHGIRPQLLGLNVGIVDRLRS